MLGGNELTRRGPMTCEEFADACLDLRSVTENSLLRQAALEHLRQCPRCSALYANLQALQDDLRYVGLETKGAEAPARVQMRLMQEFRTKHKTQKTRRAALIAAWGLAAAAVIVAGVSWTNWSHESVLSAFRRKTPSVQVAVVNANKPRPSEVSTGTLEIGETLVASSTSGDFTLLPGTTPSPMEDATVVRVQMQRDALGALGFTVNEEHAADLIQVDLLVGDDGLPQAVRLPESTE